MRSPREHCVAVIKRLQGEDGIAAFLRTPQPALGDLTGGQLLQADPDGLLRRLQALEADLENIDLEDIAADPIIDHAPEIRGHGKIKRVLEILDDIGVEELRSQNYEGRGAE